MVLELQRADDVIAELERYDHQALHFDGRVGDALVARHIVDHDRLTARRHGAPQRRDVLRRLPPPFPAALGAMHQRHYAIVESVDPEIAPIHQPVRQPLDALERVRQADVGGDHRLHRVDLVQLLGRDRFVDHLLEQQAEEREDEADQNPRPEGPGHHRPDEDRGGKQRRGVRDHLVAHDHQPLGRLQLGADDQTEVEEHAAEHEVGERVSGECRQQLDVDHGDRRAAGHHAQPAQDSGVDAEGGDEGDDLTPQIDPGDAERLALPQ